MKRFYTFAIALLAIFLLFPLAASSATYKGTITIEVGEEYSVDVGFNYSTVSGSWSKTNSTFIFVTKGQRECKIRGNQVGSGTLKWWGVVNADTFDYYWDVEVVSASTPTSSIDINSTNFPDDDFRNWLLQRSYGKDGVLTDSEIKGITEINVDAWGRTFIIKSLKGIEYFTALTKLNCSYNQLTSLDVSKNTVLETLDCAGNQLTSLDVSKNTVLKELDCSSNQLTSLDVSKNTVLETLDCAFNQLTSLDVSKNTKLTGLICGSNQLTFLDVSKNTKLQDLRCFSNQLTSLDVSKNTALTWLYCSWNPLTSLDVSKNTLLTWLSCDGNQLTSLDVSKNTALTRLSCYGNQLTSLDVSKNTALTWLSCFSNQLTSLDVSKNTALTRLDCYRNQLTSLDVSKNTALTCLECYSNKIKGRNMDDLIMSLPQNYTSETYEFYVIDNREGDEGNVCTKSQVATVKAKGWTPKYYDFTEEKWLEYGGSEDEAPALKGDVNGDGEVNGTDYVALINMILGKTDEKLSGDVNDNGTIDGADYVTLVNIILGKNNSRMMAPASDECSLSIEPFSIKAGETKEMIIDLTNPNDEITLVQFDLSLPEGLSVAMKDGEYAIDIAGRTTWKNHSLDANAIDGIIRFLLSSTKNAVLQGTSGAIISIKLTADDSYKDGSISLKNILLVTPDEKEIKPADVEYIPDPVSYISCLEAKNLDIKPGETKELLIGLTNPDAEITLVQFDMKLPDSLSIAMEDGEYAIDIAGRTTWKKHSLDANATDGVIRFLLSSTKNAVLEGTSGDIISIKLTAGEYFRSGVILVKNILLVTPDECEIRPTDMNINVNVIGTGIAANRFEAVTDNRYYNLNGQRLQNPVKGVNIIDGKKVVIK